MNEIIEKRPRPSGWPQEDEASIAADQYLLDEEAEPKIEFEQLTPDDPIAAEKRIGIIK